MLYLRAKPPHWGKCHHTSMVPTLPADSNPEIIEKQDGMPANFQIPRYPPSLPCISPMAPESTLIRRFWHPYGTN